MGSVRDCNGHCNGLVGEGYWNPRAGMNVIALLLLAFVVFVISENRENIYLDLVSVDSNVEKS